MSRSSVRVINTFSATPNVPPTGVLYDFRNVPRKQGQLSGVSALSAGIGMVVLRRTYRRRVMGTFVSRELRYTLVSESSRGDTMRWQAVALDRWPSEHAARHSRQSRYPHLCRWQTLLSRRRREVVIQKVFLQCLSRAISLSDQDHKEVNQSITDIPIGVPVDAACLRSWPRRRSLRFQILLC